MTPFETPLIPKELWLRLASHERTVRVVEHIEEHGGRRSSLERAAEVAGMERTAFARFFRTRAGTGYSEFRRAYRVALAIRHMELRERSVPELTHELGYRRIETFERDFRRVTGMSPSAYRDRHLLPLGLAPLAVVAVTTDGCWPMFDERRSGDEHQGG